MIQAGKFFKETRQPTTCNMAMPAPDAFCFTDHLPEGCLLRNQNPATPMRDWAPTQLMSDCGVYLTEFGQLPILCPVTLPYGPSLPKDPVIIGGQTFVLGLVDFTPAYLETLAAWYKHQGHQGKTQFKLGDKLWSPSVTYESEEGPVTVTFGGFDRLFRGSKKAARQMFVCGDNGNGQAALFRLVHFMDDINGDRGHFKQNAEGLFVPSTKKDWWIGFVKETDDTDTDDALIFPQPAQRSATPAVPSPFEIAQHLAMPVLINDEDEAIARWFPTAIGCASPQLDASAQASPTQGSPAQGSPAQAPPAPAQASPAQASPSPSQASPGAIRTVIPRKKPRLDESKGHPTSIDVPQILNLDLQQLFDQLRNLQQAAKQAHSENTTLRAENTRIHAQNAALTTQVIHLTNKRKMDSDHNPNPKKKPQAAPQIPQAAYPPNMAELAAAFLAKFGEQTRENAKIEEDAHAKFGEQTRENANIEEDATDPPQDDI
jgi:regulator of replication initiation timing